MASARGSATREATLRCGEPVQLQLWVKDFLPAIAPKNTLSGRAMGVLQIVRWWNSAPDLPDVSNVFAGIAQSIHAGDRQATLHGVVFDILVGSERRVGPCGCLSR
jgi:hypothetical protein